MLKWILVTISLFLATLFYSSGLTAQTPPMEKKHSLERLYLLPQDPLVLKSIEEKSAEIEQLKVELKKLKAENDSLKVGISEEAYFNGRKIEKIKYYVSICDRRPRNKKYFFGWVKRTLAQ